MNMDSYPPLFSSNSNNTLTQNIDLDEPIEHTEDLDPIPVIDLQCLNLEKLDEACKNWGVFRLINHGVPSTLVSQIQDQARKLFSLSFEYKQAILNSPLSYVSGTVFLSSSGKALTTSQGLNWVEVINFPLTQLSQFQAQDSMLDSFRLVVEEYGRHLARLASTIFQVIEKNLNLDPSQSKSHLAESTGFVRVHRYPQIAKGNQAWGARVHTDSSVLSILSQDQIGGLEVFKENKWLPVKPVANTFIVNLGDMMQVISNDEYKSVKHRVRVCKQEDRISINYFVFPDFDSVIESSKYKPFTYKEFRAQGQKDIETLGFIVGLEGFKLDK
ncbi:gibberellin 2-beta-dioxygenase 8-like [Durio zibethinus]|uniref:Gibberellin 2-beta-dioxygenase 8-like n=1 Tax=Durio zibethinus TaxID=66656 RepID=A0A6P5XUI4_DURZI|nr:gibberellin 2-beta-dioxygenase 8-like [Durio zibethinus]